MLQNFIGLALLLFFAVLMFIYYCEQNLGVVLKGQFIKHMRKIKNSLE
jgi:hypothetical protein